MAETDLAPESFDRLRHQIQSRYDDLSPHLQKIAGHALMDPNGFALETIAVLSERIGVQPSTLVRFAKEFGYSGFSNMQKVFKLRLIEGVPVSRERIYAHREKLETLAGDDPKAILDAFTEASELCLDRLRDTVPAENLRKAIEMLHQADSIYVIGQRRAFPIAAYISYGLTRLEYRCNLLDSVGGMVPQQVATLRPSDLLVAISFAEYAPSVVEVVRDAHIRGVPTLTITDTDTSPLARHGSVYFTVDDAEIHRFRPIAGAITLVQSLIVALGYYRDNLE